MHGQGKQVLGRTKFASVNSWADCKAKRRRDLFSLTRPTEWWLNRTHLGSLVWMHTSEISLPPWSGKKINHISVLTCLLLASKQPPHCLFPLVVTQGRQSCFLPHAWGSKLVRAIQSQWESTQKERNRHQRSWQKWNISCKMPLES